MYEVSGGVIDARQLRRFQRFKSAALPQSLGVKSCVEPPRSVSDSGLKPLANHFFTPLYLHSTAFRALEVL